MLNAQDLVSESVMWYYLPDLHSKEIATITQQTNYLKEKKIKHMTCTSVEKGYNTPKKFIRLYTHHSLLLLRYEDFCGKVLGLTGLLWGDVLQLMEVKAASWDSSGS